MTFKLLGIFPQIFASYLGESIIKRAQEQKAIKIESYDLRDWANDKHRRVDDTPYGGGAGMLMKIEPLYQALKTITKNKAKKRKIILLSAQGKRWSQSLAQKYSKYDELVLISGRYEGVDDRIKKIIDEEISIGDYVLTGGELGALVIIDSITRLLPGVLLNADSLKEESHSQPGVLEYPQYTKPAEFKIGQKKYSVPAVLLSGNHQKIKEWRDKNQKKIK
ncbi:MAG TPA: tRNA (guanosine(37)-N1)-methyltransferase TrmD [bacterium]|nr:tRNA (guanosine(37)-N1)-methyltransferase TrmD [bacterium]HPT29466.1 tRNA (guanosine(37)-N1)-methyltransferase TrmD [bacterium]